MNYDDALRYLEKHINLEAKAGRWEGLSLDHLELDLSALFRADHGMKNHSGRAV